MAVVRRLILLIVVLACYVAPAQAAPITYDFSATLTAGGTVTGMFTLDTDVPKATDWSLTGPGGTFDTSNSFQFVHSVSATSPNADFVQVLFFDEHSNEVALVFKTSLAAFDPSTFYIGQVLVNSSELLTGWNCDVVEGACTGLEHSEFSSGTVTVAPALEPVPEPASMTLLGLGLIGMGARRWRRRKAA